MREKMQSNYGIVCLLTAVVASFPISCNYIMTGGIVTEWIARIRELSEGFRSGHFYLFPRPETLAATGILENTMNSNLWFLPAGFLYRLTGNMVAAYRIYMLLLQAGTFLTAALCFRRIFRQRETGLPACVGVVLYLTNPYRIYVCYDLANLSQATALLLLPLYVWAVLELFDEGKGIGNLAVAAAALAGIGYADVIFFLSAAALTLLAGILSRRLFPLLAVAAGCALFFPGLYRLLRYLFPGGYPELNMPLQLIMQKGYHFGELFNSYAFRDGRPGMGLGLFLCLLSIPWMGFVHREGEADKGSRAFFRIALLLTAMSLSCFPWDVLQRLGGWAVRLISLIDTPAVFWGMATAAFCVPAASGMARTVRCEEKAAAIAFPAVVVLFCVGICVYQCNTLTYTRLPMELGF